MSILGGRVALVVNALTTGELKAGNVDASRVFTLLRSRDLGMCDPNGPGPLLDCKRKEEFLTVFDGLLEKWNTNDQLLLYFSGHGSFNHGVYRLQVGMGSRDNIPFKNILTSLTDAGVRRAIIIIDACHSGGALGEKSEFRPVMDEEIPRGVAILTSSRASEKSYELEDKSGSVFTKLLCDGIETGIGPTADSYINVADVAKYVNDQLKTEPYSKYPQRSLYKINDADRAIWISKNRRGRIADAVTGPPVRVRNFDELKIAYETTAESRHPCEGAALDELDWSLVESYARKSGFGGELTERERLLAEIGLFSPLHSNGQKQLHRAAVLCFARAPEKHIPQARSMFVLGNPAEPEFQRQEVLGPLSIQVERLHAMTMGHLATVSTFDDGAKRRDEYEIPARLVRELLSNAVTHRDYRAPGTVQVHVTAHSLNVISPGSFPDNATWESMLERASESCPTDAAVALYMSRLDVFENVGRGFHIIRDYIRERGGDSITCKVSPTPTVTISVRRSRFDSAHSQQEGTGISAIPERRPAVPVPIRNVPAFTIELKRRGAELERRFHFRNYAGDISNKQSFDSIGVGLRIESDSGLSALQRLLWPDRSTERDQPLSGVLFDRVAATLFETLFGPDEAQMTTVLRAAFELMDEPGAPSPLRQPLRVRIWCNDPELASLPWHMAGWRGHLLCNYGWTFEVCSERSPGTHVDFTSPGRILILAPGAGEADDKLAVEKHLAELMDLLSTMPSVDVRIARSRESFYSEWKVFRPDTIYFYGHSAVDNGKHAFLIDALSVQDLAPRLLQEQHVPAAMLINTCGSARELSTTGLLLSHAIPLVIVNAMEGRLNVARQFALAWFKAWLGERVEPVPAAYHLNSRNPTPMLSEWALPMIFTKYDSWSTRHPPTLKRLRGADQLNRASQRGSALHRILNLVTSPEQRVEALIAYGRPGNSIEIIAKQIVDYVGFANDRLKLRRVSVQFPVLRGASLTSNEFEKSLLRYAPTLQQVLVALAPRGIPRVLCIDWGVLRGQDAYASEISAWLKFGRDSLTLACPGDLRIVALLAIEADGKTFGRLATNLPSLPTDYSYRTAQFRCAVLDPLESVSHADLLDFLHHHDCEPQVQKAIADAIFTASGGRYEDTTALLNEGISDGWHRLLERLGGVVPPEADF